MLSALDWLANRIEPFGLFRTLITLIFTGLAIYTLFEAWVFVRSLMRASKRASTEELAEEVAAEVVGDIEKMERAARSATHSSDPPPAPSRLADGSARLHAIPALDASMTAGGPALGEVNVQRERATDSTQAAKDLSKLAGQSEIGAAWAQAKLLRATASAFSAREMNDERRARLDSISRSAMRTLKRLVYIRLLRLISYRTLLRQWSVLLQLAILLIANGFATYYFYTMP